MAATKEKKKMKAELKADPLKEMSKAAKALIQGNAALKKKFSPITHSEEIEADPKKWDVKKLAEGCYSVARYELKILANRVDKATKEKGKDAGKLAKDLAKEYEEMKTEIIAKVSKALEEVVNDKGDNKKALKDGKTAIAQVEKADVAKTIGTPLKNLQKILQDATKALGGGDKKGGDKIKQAVEKAVNDTKTELDKSAKTTESAIGKLMKTTKQTAANKDADAELKGLGEKMVKQAGTFASLSKGLEKLNKKLAEAAKDVKGGKLDEAMAKKWQEEFDGLSSLLDDAKEVNDAVKEFKSKFTTLQRKLK